MVDSNQKIAFEFHTNIFLIIVAILIGNASDYLRHNVKKDPNLTCRPLLRLLTDLPEATLATMVGALFGLIIKHGFNMHIRFSDSIFFYFILPPIIFYQGYSLKKRNFFRYFHYILSLGVGGTLIQFAILVVCVRSLNKLWYAWHLPLWGWGTKGKELSTVDVLLLCAVLTSADEVAALAIIKQEAYPKLSAVLFGEGVLNDAVSILLFRTVLAGGEDNGSLDPVDITWRACYLMTISILIGAAVGLIISRIMKINTGLLEHPTRQTIIIMLGCYSSYAASEMVEVPGVLSVFVCGIIFSHYAWHSLSSEAKVGTAIASHSLSTIAETYSFTALGLSIYRFENDDWSFRFCCIAVISLIIARALVTYGIFTVGRMFSKHRFNMDFKEQSVLFVAGLVRGAITWAQALQIESSNRKVMVSTCLTTICFTLVVVGGAMPAMLRLLGFEQSDSTDVGEMIEGASVVSNASSDDLESVRSFGSLGGVGNLLPRYERSRSKESPMPVGRPQLDSNMSYDGIILHGFLHRWWIRLDETVKPFFGGKSRSSSADGMTSRSNSMYNTYGSIASHSPVGGSSGGGGGGRGREGGREGREGCGAGGIDKRALAALNEAYTRERQEGYVKKGVVGR